MVSSEVIRAESLSRKFSGNEIISDISFEVKKGESLSVIGPSGCGKTTLLYIISELISPSSGRLFINGTETGGTQNRTAFILQDYGLLPWKNVLHNAELGMKIRGTGPSERREAALKILAELGIDAHINRYPASLSGGEKQRVAIARALASGPEILLMDEPFSSLDTLTREKLQYTITDIQAAHGLTMITVTHSIEEAVYLGDRIMVMTPGPGSISRLVNNEGRRKPGFRDSENFFKTCSKIRRSIEKG
ncbi:MAG TPA: ABC transporter ATP-binding protein [Spirochaetota bacterium]|nr:ABC transporter ATP-binding protein [Spirochaetota bacterium]